MTIRNYLNGLWEALGAAFPDPDREMTLSDLGQFVMICSEYAAKVFHR